MESEKRFSGMTVNERLYVSGLMNSFESCIKNKDVEGIKSILRKVELVEKNIQDIVTSLDFDS
jgi:hypothetical protein